VAIPKARLQEVVFEALRRDFGNQWLGLTQAVAWVAIEQGMTPPRQDTRIIQIEPEDEPGVRAYVLELIADGVLTPGIEGGQTDWPWISLTPHGRDVVFQNQDPVPPPEDSV
jgi:hypothetical protein